MKIEGKVAIVTGGASGLGKATAEALVAAGAKVAIWDMNEELGREVVAQLGENAYFTALNVTDAAAVVDKNVIKGDGGPVWRSAYSCQYCRYFPSSPCDQ